MNLAARRQAAMQMPVPVQLRLRGRVQGVGMRPAIWQLAQAMGLRGQVKNDGADVLVDIWEGSEAARRLLGRLRQTLPPLADIHEVEESLLPVLLDEAPSAFAIMASETGHDAAVALPDAAPCADCLQEMRDPASRRYRYAFTSCSHCGPRLSIQMALPWDRAQTSMAGFRLCRDCQREYDDPTDRRFHAQPIACPACGPQLALLNKQGEQLAHAEQDAIAACAALLQAGQIVALKGIGGFHLACDASNQAAVARLRAAKHREAKPFAVMLRDLSVAARYVELSAVARQALGHHTAPAVILPVRADAPTLAAGVAPGLQQLAVMLPSSPMHHLLLESFEQPLIMTSGNMSSAPPCIDNDEALQTLGEVADAFVVHDRDIVNRLDDSVLKLQPDTDEMQPIRLARGYAPLHLPLPPGLAVAEPILALGGELKASFCLLTEAGATLGQHIGDLEQLANLEDYQQALQRYQALFRFTPRRLVVDRHPEYLSRKLGLAWAEAESLAVTEVQHHHAHIAACMAEHAVPLVCRPVLGIALDGLGMGEAGELWGGEFLLADYVGFERVGCLQPFPLLGGGQALHEPWRNLYAQLIGCGHWQTLTSQCPEHELVSWLQQQPLENLDQMMARALHSPLCSSAGRWFDAVAAALGLCRERQSFEGQAAMLLEAQVTADTVDDDVAAYPFTLLDHDLPKLSPDAMWPLLIDDLAMNTSRADIAARFHAGLTQGLLAMVDHILQRHCASQVVLSGGVFQNRRLLDGLTAGLSHRGYEVLNHRQLPPNDGGLALGQAVVAAARQFTQQRSQ